MQIDVRHDNPKYIVYIWDESPYEEDVFNEVFTEDVYVEMNNWCVETLGFHARTAYNVFEFKNKKDYEWFLLRWS